MNLDSNIIPSNNPIQSTFDSFMELNAKVTDRQYFNQPEIKMELKSRLKHFMNTCELMELNPIKTLLMKMDEHRTQQLTKSEVRLAS